jgi:hypothetical protein
LSGNVEDFFKKNYHRPASLNHSALLQAAPPETNKQAVEKDGEFHEPLLWISKIASGQCMPAGALATSLAHL